MNTSATEKTPAAAEVDTRATAAKPWWYEMLRTRATAILVLDIILFVFFTIRSTDGAFATGANIQSLLIAATEALLLAVGLAMLLGAGVFDLSLGANLVLSSVVGAKVMHAVAKTTASGDLTHVGSAIFFGLVACLLMGAAFGAVNGVLVAYLRINPLIATLGTLGVGTGVAYVVSSGSDISGLPPQIQENFGLKTVAGDIPIPALIAIVVALVFYVVIRYTRFGMRTLAIGSSFHSAERVGIRAPEHLMRLAVIAGLLAGTAGFIDLAHYASTTINGHSNDALNAVTAAVIGGTLLEGGKVSIIGAIWGTGLAVILQGGLVIIGVSSYYQLIVVGVVLIVAVAIDRIAYVRQQRS